MLSEQRLHELLLSVEGDAERLPPGWIAFARAVEREVLRTDSASGLLAVRVQRQASTLRAIAELADESLWRFKMAPSDNELIDAAQERAAIYDGDDRQDIQTDVMNAFYAGAAFVIDKQK